MLERDPVIRIATAVLIVILPVLSACQREDESESLGDVRFDTSCSPDVRKPFDRAVALLHHMSYTQSRAEFSAIASRDPLCAMAHWGVAMTLFQPLWPTRPTEEDLRRGREEVAEARRIGAGTERERLYIAAAAAFFESTNADYWDRIAGWAEAMRAVHEANPDDIESTSFFALSRLAVAPVTGGQENNQEAASILEGVLRTSPRHPGAIHYTIHANDADGRQSESLDVVRRYSEIAPRNPHALHMPTHIYTRLGDWKAVIDGNRHAAEAALENPAGDQGQWVWDEFPHALEYLVYALLQTGEDSTARAEMERLQGTAHLQPTFKTAFHLSSIPARYALERRDWEMAAALEPRPDTTLAWERFPWPEAVTWFARGLGSARTGQLDASREAGARLASLRDASTALGEDLFARQTEILRLEVEAWTARGTNGDAAVDLMQEAVDLEAHTPKHPVTPAPTLPATELLGDLLLELNRPDAALVAYRVSLERTPGRLNSLAGAARAADRSGDATAAAGYFRQLRAQAVERSKRREVLEADAYLRGHPDGE